MTASGPRARRTIAPIGLRARMFAGHGLALSWAEVALAVLSVTIFTGVVIVRDSVFGVSPITQSQLRFIAAPLTLLAIVWIVRNHKLAGYLFMQHLWLAALIGWAWMTTFWSVDPNTTAMRSLAITMSLICAIGLATRFDPMMLVRIVAVALTIGTSLSVIGFMIGDPMVWDSLAWVGLRGVFTHKNLLGQCCVMALILGAGLMLQRGSDRWLGVVVVLFALRALWLSKSATGLAAGAIGLALLIMIVALTSDRLPRMVKPLMVTAAAGAAAAALVFREQIINLLGRESTLTGRDEIWEFAIDRIREEPLLGHGFRAYFTAPGNDQFIKFYFKGQQYDQAHSSVLQTMLDLGLVGFALLVAFVLTTLIRSPQALIDPARRVWVVLFVAILINAQTEALILSPTGFTWLVWQLAAFAIVAGRNPPLLPSVQPRRFSRPPQRQARPLPP
jgi:exopolysaccharide production protein ExoQ